MRRFNIKYQHPHENIFRNDIKILIILTFFLGLITYSVARNNIRLSGYVYDKLSGSPLGGVQIRLKNTPYYTNTIEDGYFQIENLPSGSYNLIISRLGYQTKSIKPVLINEDHPYRMQVELEPVPIVVDTVFVEGVAAGSEFDSDGAKTVINRETIEKYQFLGLSQLIQNVAGIQIESDGGKNSPATIRIHGSSSNQVLVMLDGQRLNNPQTGEVDLNIISPEDIEKITIIQQGNSAVYGGNAYAGVLAFESRKIGEENSVTLESEFGSFESAGGKLTGGLNYRNLFFLANYTQTYSHNNFSYLYQDQEFQRDNAWNRSGKIFTKLDYTSPKFNTSLIFQFRKLDRGLPSAFYNENKHYGAYSENQYYIFHVHQRWYFSSRAYFEALLGRTQIEQLFNNIDDPSPFTRYKTRQNNINYDAQVLGYYEIPFILDVRFGMNYLEENLKQEDLLYQKNSIGKKERKTIAAYGSIDLNLPTIQPLFRVQRFHAALRYERSFDQVSDYYPLIGISVVPKLLPVLKMSSSWSKAVRYPDFNSLFWKSDARAQGNPDLQPERKRTWNINLRVSPGYRYLPQMGFYYYNEKLKDLIFWHRGVQGIWEPRNEDKVQKNGFDLDLAQWLIYDHIKAQATYSHINGINKTDEFNRKNKQIVFIPKHTVNTSLFFTFNNLHSILIYRYVSSRETVPANTQIPLNEYHLLDLILGYQFRISKILLYPELAVKNITSADYELLRGYPMPGRAFYFSLQLKYKPN